MYYHFHLESEARAFLEAHREEGSKAVVWGYPHPDTRRPFYSIFIPRKG